MGLALAPTRSITSSSACTGAVLLPLAQPTHAAWVWGYISPGGLSKRTTARLACKVSLRRVRWSVLSYRCGREAIDAPIKAVSFLDNTVGPVTVHYGLLLRARQFTADPSIRN